MRTGDTNVRKPATVVSPALIAGPVHMCFDGFELDEANARLLREGQPVALAPTPFAVLCSLARQPGALISKDVLLDAVWGHRFVSDSVLKTAVSELRSAFADDARRPRYIETVSRRGYRFIGVASELTVGPAPAVGAAVPSESLSEHKTPATTLARRAPRSLVGARN